MSYDQFVQEIERRIKEKVGDKYKIYIFTAIKNNGYERKGIAFEEEGVNISPTIYLEGYYEVYQREENLENIIKHIMEVYQEVRHQESVECDYIKDFERVKKDIIFHLINQEKNEEMLKRVPHIPYLDLAIVFYLLIDIGEDRGRVATLRIEEEQMRWWNVTKEVLYPIALKNLEEQMPAELASLTAVALGVIPAFQPDVEVHKAQMYVMTNSTKCFGASTILYEGRLKEIGDCMRENYYVIPSSVHEVLLIPESKGVGKEEYVNMICEANETVVEPEEVLAYRPYYYDRKVGALHML